ncbi:hypothetical protein Tco_0403742 [Tanacetum coccineum]
MDTRGDYFTRCIQFERNNKDFMLVQVVNSHFSVWCTSQAEPREESSYLWTISSCDISRNFTCNVKAAITPIEDQVAFDKG